MTEPDAERAATERRLRKAILLVPPGFSAVCIALTLATKLPMCMGFWFLGMAAIAIGLTLEARSLGFPRLVTLLQRVTAATGFVTWSGILVLLMAWSGCAR